MNKYNVTITETLKKTVEVEAESLEDAKEKVNDEWKDGIYILDADNFTDVQFEAQEVPSLTKLKIYQVNMDRDKNRVAFQGLNSLAAIQGSIQIDKSIYDEVFNGTMNINNLEETFYIFNQQQPEGYTGRSLSVSDVIEIESSEKIIPGFYYCDTVGFQEIEFAEQKQNKETMKVVLLKPFEYARAAEIGMSLEAMQAVVGGLIEPAYYFDEEVCLICNEEGKINGMPLNRAIYDKDKNMIDIIAGTAFICDCSGQNFGSLTEEQIKRYTEQFKKPERFVRINGKIRAIPFKPDKERER